MRNPTNLPINPLNSQPLLSVPAYVAPIRPSKCLLMLVTGMHLTSIVSFLYSHLLLVWAQIPIILLALHLGYYWYQWRRLSDYRLQYSAQRWYLCEQQKNTGLAKSKQKKLTRLHIKACYYWSRFLVILIVEEESSRARKRHMPIVYDCCSASGFRFIKVMSKSMLAP